MSAKQLLPDQHVPLHYFYGRDDCCLCEHMVTIGNFERKLEAMQNVADAARIILKVATAATRRGGYEAICPHGNGPFYPAHGRWCDDCFGRLEDALAALGRKGD